MPQRVKEYTFLLSFVVYNYLFKVLSRIEEEKRFNLFDLALQICHRTKTEASLLDGIRKQYLARKAAAARAPARSDRQNGEMATHESTPKSRLKFYGRRCKDIE